MTRHPASPMVCLFASVSLWPGSPPAPRCGGKPEAEGPPGSDQAQAPAAVPASPTRSRWSL